MEKVSDWSVPNQFKNKIDIETAKLCLRLGEQNLMETNEISNRLTNRSYSMLTILVAAISFLIGTLWDACQNTSLNMYKIVLCLIPLFPAMYCIYLIYKLISLHVYHSMGREPKEIINEKYINDNVPLAEQLCFVTVANLTNIQDKITKMKEENAKRLSDFQKVVKIIIYTFAFLIFVMLVGLLFIKPQETPHQQLYLLCSHL